MTDTDEPRTIGVEPLAIEKLELDDRGRGYLSPDLAGKRVAVAILDAEEIEESDD